METTVSSSKTQTSLWTTGDVTIDHSRVGGELSELHFGDVLLSKRHVEQHCALCQRVHTAAPETRQPRYHLSYIIHGNVHTESFYGVVVLCLWQFMNYAYLHKPFSLCWRLLSTGNHPSKLI